MLNRIRSYYHLTKPGIVYGNILHVVAGFCLAAQYGLSFIPFIGVVSGTALVIASACVVNNYFDRDIDAKMLRTKRRALVQDTISRSAAVWFAVLLSFIGFTLLTTLTNKFVVVLGIIAFVSYAGVYTYAKRRTVHSTLLGTIPGALPPMAGYVALSGEITIAAWAIFLLVVLWQLPHFYAIAVFRRQEYAAAKVPVLSVVASFQRVRVAIIVGIAVYCLWVAALIVLGVFAFFTGMILLLASVWWLYVALRNPIHHIAWAKQVFGVSLQVSILFVAVSILNIVFV